MLSMLSRGYLFIEEKLEKNAKLKEAIPFMILLILGYYVFSPMVFRAELPLTDASGHYFKTWYLKKSIEEFKEFPNWCSYWYGGYPIFHFYSPGAYVLIYALHKASSLPLTESFNTLFAIFAISESIMLYLIMTRLNFPKIPSLLSGMLLLSNPRFIKDIGYSGSITYHVAAIPAFTSIFFLISAFKTKSKYYTMLSGIFFGITILCHQTTTIALLSPLFLIVSAVYLIFERDKKLTWIPLTSILVGFVISSYWWIPAVRDHAFYYATYPGSIRLSISNILDPNHLRYMGRIHILLGLLGLFFCMTELNKKETLIPSIWGISLFLFAYVIPNPMYSAILASMIVYPLNMLGGISICWLLHFKNSELFKINAVVASLVIFFILVPSFSSNHSKLENWQEPVMTNPGMLQYLFDAFKSVPYGNTISYGIFQPAMSSAIPVMSGKPNILGWYHQGSHHYPIYERYLFDSVDTKDPKRLYDLYRLGGVRWIGIRITSQKALDIARMAYNNPNLFKFVWGQRFGNIQMLLIEVLDSKQAYIVRNGKFTDENVTFIQEKPGRILIKTNAEGSYKIYIAQSYFPNWVSSNGKITKTEYGFMIIPGSKEAVLEYKQGAIDLLTKIISLLSFFIALFFTHRFWKEKHPHRE